MRQTQLGPLCDVLQLSPPPAKGLTVGCDITGGKMSTRLDQRALSATAETDTMRLY